MTCWVPPPICRFARTPPNNWGTQHRKSTDVYAWSTDIDQKQCWRNDVSHAFTCHMPMFSGCPLGDDPHMTCSAMCSEWFNEDPAAVDDWSHYNPTICSVSFIHLLVPYLTIRKSSWCRIFSIVVEKTQLGILNILVNLAHCSRYDTVATKMGSTHSHLIPSVCLVQDWVSRAHPCR